MKDVGECFAEESTKPLSIVYLHKAVNGSFRLMFSLPALHTNNKDKSLLHCAEKET